jgi:hypothetical protein
MATLLDTLTRHQFYLEGVKAGQTLRFERVIVELRAAIRAELLKFDFFELDELSRNKINELVRSIRAIQKTIYTQYTEDAVRELLLFLEVESDIAFDIFADEEDGVPIFPWFVKRPTNEELQRLWAFATNAPIPANGVLMLPFLQSFANVASRNVENAIYQEWVNKSNRDELLTRIAGTKTLDYKDGMLKRIVSQNGAVLDTIIQHVSAIGQSAVASVFYRKYRWVSIIDNATTDICRSRNQNVYDYGSGPLPPAHIRCRSKIVPFNATNPLPDDMPPLYDWLKAQPAIVQDDLLGTSEATLLRSGKAKAADFARFKGSKPLSLAQFKAKRALMKTD